MKKIDILFSLFPDILSLTAINCAFPWYQTETRAQDFQTKELGLLSWLGFETGFHYVARLI
jgi:hypothetical protein